MLQYLSCLGQGIENFQTSLTSESELGATAHRATISVNIRNYFLTYCIELFFHLCICVPFQSIFESKLKKWAKYHILLSLN